MDVWRPHTSMDFYRYWMREAAQWRWRWKEYREHFDMHEKDNQKAVDLAYRNMMASYRQAVSFKREAMV